MTKHRTNSDGIASSPQMQSNAEEGSVPPPKIHPQSLSVRTPGPRSMRTRSLRPDSYVSQPSSPGSRPFSPRSRPSSPRSAGTEPDANHNKYLLDRGIKPQAIQRVCASNVSDIGTDICIVFSVVTRSLIFASESPSVNQSQSVSMQWDFQAKQLDAICRLVLPVSYAVSIAYLWTLTP